jgi:TM2 domain-containing membrane protein YozV
MQPSDKSRAAAFLFAFFLGTFGVHRFYVGKIGTGITMLILTLSLFGILITAFWALIDWIIIVSGGFRDADGRLITTW